MKRKLLLFILFVLSVHFAVAQSADRKTALAVYSGTIQYNGEFGNQFFKTENLQGAFAVSIASYVSPSFNLGLMYMRGDVYYTNSTDFLFGNTSNINLFIHYKFFNGKIFKENARISPYLITGFGGNDWNIRLPEKARVTGAFVPLGIGFRIRINNSFAVLLQSEFHLTFSDDYDKSNEKSGSDQFLHSLIGLSFNIGEGKDTDGDKVKDKKDRCPNTPKGVEVDLLGCPLDHDSDGVVDYLDQCPDLYGYLSAKGCPDKDHDSITDKDDQCPDISGPRETFGCPDRDQDGVLDADDICPDAKGLSALNGCPDRDDDLIADKDDVCPDEKGIDALHGCPDRDGDGIADKDDLCPDSSGIAANKGCPEVKEEVKKIFEQALTGLQFETGKDKIKKSSFKIMDAVVKVMSEHAEYKLVINGHTDNVGNSERNKTLSVNRAAAAKKYLTDHSIEEARITSNGFGDTVPVADNKTKKGRAQNRRVEFKVVFE